MLQEYGKSTERVYEVVTGNDNGINTMDCAHANYLGHVEFCRSNGLGNVCFGRYSAKMTFIYKVVGWSFEISWNTRFRI